MKLPRAYLYLAINLILLSNISLAQEQSADTSSSHTDSFVRQNGTEILDRSGKPLYIKGVNLGGSFLWEGWMFGGGILSSETKIFERLSDIQALGPDAAVAFRHTVYENWIQKTDIAQIKALGFNTVRIPINHTIIEDPARTIYLDRIIDWCEELGIYAILDLHSAPYAQNAIGLISDWNWGEPTMWDWFKFKKAKISTAALWQIIAKRYRTRKIILGYDLLNEPDTSHTGLNPFNKHKLPKMYKAIIEAIREVDPHHMVIIEGDKFAKDFSQLTKPLDSNMAYQFHIYSWTVEKSYKADINNWITTAHNQNTPIFAGEFGVGTLQDIQSQMDAFKIYSDKLSGWVIWSWKSTDNQDGEWNGTPSSEINHSIREVSITPDWEKTINYATKSSKSTPDKTTLSNGIKEFSDNMLFEKTKENKHLLKILFSKTSN